MKITNVVYSANSEKPEKIVPGTRGMIQRHVLDSYGKTRSLEGTV